MSIYSQFSCILSVYQIGTTTSSTISVDSSYTLTLVKRTSTESVHLILILDGLSSFSAKEAYSINKMKCFSVWKHKCFSFIHRDELHSYTIVAACRHIAIAYYVCDNFLVIVWTWGARICLSLLWTSYHAQCCGRQGRSWSGSLDSLLCSCQW